MRIVWQTILMNYIIPYFWTIKILQNLSSAAFVIGTLRVKTIVQISFQPRSSIITAVMAMVSGTPPWSVSRPVPSIGRAWPQVWWMLWRLWHWAGTMSMFMWSPRVECSVGAQTLKPLGNMFWERVSCNHWKKFLFDLILYVPVNNLSVMSDGSSWVEPVLSKD